MKKLSSAQVRQMFLDFFKEKGHDVEPSAPIVPKDDPSLLFINSGVSTMKKYFDGREIPKNPRIVNSQKSIRTNDIENVGFTARHHTFFEMLGNFSIGDYFKKEAITYAWEFLTDDKWLAFNPDLLSVTVHPEDDEAYDLWLNMIKLPEERIIRLEENYWDIGEGPSGPNTEIFYDRGENYGSNPEDPELYPGGENERYLEIWNLVFSQFNHNSDGTYTPLPKKNIDTGMGLERVVSIIQDAPTNFETDLFLPIIHKIEELANQKYGIDDKTDTAYKVIADHIRTIAFAIGDGALPSNEGRGYVLRRLLRRAVRFAKQIGIDQPFMYQLVHTTGDIMKSYYPEVLAQEEFIVNVVKMEEERFHETLHEGLEMLTEIMKREKENNQTVVPGTDVFKLYDTYGFPVELTKELVEEEGFTIDETVFEEEMAKQRERARSARQKVDSMKVQDGVLSQIDVESAFIGYEHMSTDAEIKTIIKDKAFVTTAEAGDTVWIVLDKTPFYAESGGQIADTGTMRSKTATASVLDVQKSPKGQHIHQVELKSGTLQVGESVHVSINRQSRSEIVKNHTATHLLHQALKDILGNHVNQAGSLVQAERLRFDFSHFGPVKEEEITDIERIVNEKIWQEIPVQIELMQIDEAKKKGAMALFGEKYGDTVRVVQLDDYSMELCGGCHVQTTSEIGLFKIVSESGIGAGVRRIEAVTSKFAYEYVNQQLSILRTAADILKTKEERVPERIDSLHHEMRTLQKENESLSAKLANVEAGSILEQVIEVKHVKVLAQQVNVKDMNQLRNMVDDLKGKIASGIILLAAVTDGKVQLAAGVTKDLINQGLHAGNLIKHAAKLCGGGGGGRPDMAQAGGKNPNGVEAALNYVQTYVDENKIE